MCAKCKEIDEQILRYRRMQQLVSDQRALDAIASLIAKCEAQKSILHSDQK